MSSVDQQAAPVSQRPRGVLSYLPKPTTSSVALTVLLLVVVLFTLYPTASIFVASFQLNRPGEPIVWGLQGWQAAFADRAIPGALANTFGLAGVRILIVTTIAIFFAWVVTRTDTPFKGHIEFMLWLGFFLPQLPMAMGWLMLLDPHFGLVNQLLREVLGLPIPPINIYSYGGIVWAHLAFSTSIRFLLITPAFRAMDSALEEAAKMSGASGFTTLWRITIPVLAPAILAAVALGFIKALESFEIEMLLGIPSGIRVYSTLVWDFIRREPPLYERATALSSVFLVVIFALIFLQRALLGRRQYTTITGRGFSVRPASLGRWRWVTFGICVAWIAIMIVLPLIFLLVGTFMRLFGFFDIDDPWTAVHWLAAFDDPIFLRSLANSLIVGLGAAFVGAFFYALISYSIIRSHFTGRTLMDFLSWLPWALPGVLLGLALLWTFVGNPLFRPIYGTAYLLILALVISGLPLGTQVLKAAIMQVSKELEESAWVSGAAWFYTFRRIVLPILKPALIAVGLITFISAVRDIPTIVFLAAPQSRTLSLLMVDYIASDRMEQAMIVGVFVTALIVVAALAGRFLLGMQLGPSREESR